MIKGLVAIGLFLCNWAVVLTQVDSIMNVKNTGLGIHKGIIVPHSSKIRDVSNSYPWGAELNMSWHLLNRSSWEYCFCYPKTGISLMYMNYDNPEVIGSSIAVYPFIEPYLGAENKFNGAFRFGFGPAYFSKVYDEVKNPDNQFVSTHLSFIVLLRLALNYRLTNETSIGFTVGFNHISNGGIKNPNLGINYPTISLNVDKYLTSPNFYPWERSNNVKLDKDIHKLMVEYFATGKAVYKAEERYLVTGLSFTYGYVLGRINGIRIGFEGVYDGAAKERIQRNALPDYFEETPDYFTLAMLLGNDFLLGRFMFYQHLGIYLYERYPYKDPVYQRYGLNYFLTDKKNVFVGINLKVHRHDADFLDFRIGYNF